MVLNREQSELQAELSEQLRLLNKACREFDSGDTGEYRNIARALRVICTSDQHENPSLIALAGRGDDRFLDSATKHHALNIAPLYALTAMVIGPDTLGLRAMLDDAPTWQSLSFEDWLSCVVIDDKEGNKFNRERLIKTVANSGGGTHYPPDVRPFFNKLVKTTFEGTRAFATVKISLHGLEQHTLRQIAHELLRTLVSDYKNEMLVESGAVLAYDFQFFLYPGRRNRMVDQTKQIENRLPPKRQPIGEDSLSSPPIRLPYEGTGRNDLCPCRSDLKFKNCCSVARDFDAAFISDFEVRTGMPLQPN